MAERTSPESPFNVQSLIADIHTHMSRWDDDQRRTELRAIAARLRADTWVLAERWSELSAQNAPADRLRGGESLIRFGEIPSFLASLAHHLEDLADSDELIEDGRDEALRRAAAEHARARAEVGYSQRDLLAEFVALRRVLWEHFAGVGADERPTFEGERIVNLLLDTVIVEAADQFFTELTDALVRRAERDQLTDVYNRQTFHDRLGRELSRAQRYGHKLTVVVIDLNAFKQVNDTLGHLAGDAVLKRLAQLLTTHTRDEDIVGRLGGDEFAVALIEADMATARDLIRRLRIHLTPTRRQFGLPKEFGVGFGSATFPEQGETVEKLLLSADARLYEQKGGGRGERIGEVPHAPEQLTRLRVLVADDDPGIRLLCQSMLEAEGFEVDVVSNGREALEHARASTPDLALLDVTMPFLDGWEVAEALGGDESTRDVPIVMMTGHAEEEHLEKAVRAGAADFVSKPFEPDELMATVNDVLLRRVLVE